MIKFFSEIKRKKNDHLFTSSRLIKNLPTKSQSKLQSELKPEPFLKFELNNSFSNASSNQIRDNNQKFSIPVEDHIKATSSRPTGNFDSMPMQRRKLVFEFEKEKDQLVAKSHDELTKKKYQKN